MKSLLRRSALAPDPLSLEDQLDIPGLVAALNWAEYDAGGNRSVRLDAIRALGRIRDASAAPALAQMLTSDSKHERELSAKALRRIGQAAVPYVLPLLAHSLREVQDIAAWTLIELPAPVAVPSLIAALERQRQGVTSLQEAIHAIGNVAIPHLLASLRHEDIHVRLAVLQVLARIPDDRSIDPLISELRAPDGCEESAIEALAAIPSPIVLRAFVPLLSRRYPRAQLFLMRYIAQHASLDPLVVQNAASTISALASDSEWGVRAYAAEALAAVGIAGADEKRRQ